jgi:hypothetical protein
MSTPNQTGHVGKIHRLSASRTSSSRVRAGSDLHTEDLPWQARSPPRRIPTKLGRADCSFARRMKSKLVWTGGALLSTQRREPRLARCSRRGLVRKEGAGARRAGGPCAARSLPARPGLAVRPEAGSAMVTAAFAVVEALSWALAVELAPTRVNTIRPGSSTARCGTSSTRASGRRCAHGEARITACTARWRGRGIGQAAVFLMTRPYVTGRCSR